MLDLAQMIDLLTKGGMLGVLLIALVGGYRGWYVWGHTHTTELTAKDATIQEKNDAIAKIEKERDDAIAKVEHDRDYWRGITMRVLTANEKTLASIVDLSQKQG